jgi:hypothetical protein
MRSVLLFSVALAALGGPAAAASEKEESKALKLKHLESLKKELEEKKKELATIEHDEAAAKAKEKVVMAKAKASNASVGILPDADRLLKGLDQIRNLKTTFAADTNTDQFSGAMSYELAHGDGIWSAIEQLTKAAAGAKLGSNNTNLDTAMASFTKVIGAKLHEVDEKDNVQNEEYVLGLLAHHRSNVTEQESILSNFTSLPAVKQLLAHHNKTGDYSAEFADILDHEHPAAKQLTSFLQRVM